MNRILEQACQQVSSGNLSQAIALWDTFLETHPDCAEAFHERAAIKGVEGQDGYGMLADYKRATELNPENKHYRYSYHFALGGAMHAAFYDESAPELLHQAIENYTLAEHSFNEHQHVYEYRGTAYMLLGKTAEAMADFSSAIEINPQSASAYFLRGTLLHQVGRRAEAKEDYESAFERQHSLEPSTLEELETCYADLLTELLG